MYLKCTLLILGIVFGSAHTNEKRVSGGHLARIGQYPYQVTIQTRHLVFSIYDNRCGGALIRPDAVLTAANCVSNKRMRVGAGLVDITDLETIYIFVSKKTVHPNFNPDSLINNIAVLKLESSFTLSYAIGVVQLPVANSIPSGKGFLAGWGTTSGSYFEPPSNDLYYAGFNILTPQECTDAMGAWSVWYIQSSNICGKSMAANACVGDEGSSLVQNNVTVGVLSWEAAYCNNRAPLAFTRVSYYVNWINNNLS